MLKSAWEIAERRVASLEFKRALAQELDLRTLYAGDKAI